MTERWEQKNERLATKREPALLARAPWNIPARRRPEHLDDEDSSIVALLTRRGGHGFATFAEVTAPPHTQAATVAETRQAFNAAWGKTQQPLVTVEALPDTLKPVRRAMPASLQLTTPLYVFEREMTSRWMGLVRTSERLYFRPISRTGSLTPLGLAHNDVARRVIAASELARLLGMRIAPGIFIGEVYDPRTHRLRTGVVSETTGIARTSAWASLLARVDEADVVDSAVLAFLTGLERDRTGHQGLRLERGADGTRARIRECGLTRAFMRHVPADELERELPASVRREVLELLRGALASSGKHCLALHGHLTAHEIDLACTRARALVRAHDEGRVVVG